MIKKIVKFLLIVLCMSMIFMFSSDNGEQSSGKSDRVIVRFCESFLGRKLKQEEKQYYIDNYVFFVRKFAHFFIYFILGILILSFLFEFRLMNYKLIFFSIFICFLYACSDEFHQLFSVGRSSEIGDVFLDTLGSSCGCFSYYFIIKLFRRNKDE